MILNVFLFVQLLILKYNFGDVYWFLYLTSFWVCVDSGSGLWVWLTGNGDDLDEGPVVVWGPGGGAGRRCISSKVRDSGVAELGFDSGDTRHSLALA